MSETVTDVIIDAPAERVWQALTDFSAYPEWNPLIRHVSGDLEDHARLTVTLAGADGSEHTSHPTVVRYRPGREIRWRDRPALPGIMDTETTFKVEPLGPEQVRFVHWHATSGLLAPFLGARDDAGLRGRLEAMNVALKGRAERAPAAAAGRHAEREAAQASAGSGALAVGSASV